MMYVGMSGKSHVIICIKQTLTGEASFSHQAVFVNEK